MAKKRRTKAEAAEDREVYNSVVFQGGRVMAGPKDMGFLELETLKDTFVVLINHANAEQLIDQLQDFLKGRAPHFARDQN